MRSLRMMMALQLWGSRCEEAMVSQQPWALSLGRLPPMPTLLPPPTPSSRQAVLFSIHRGRWSVSFIYGRGSWGPGCISHIQPIKPSLPLRLPVPTQVCSLGNIYVTRAAGRSLRQLQGWTPQGPLLLRRPQCVRAGEHSQCLVLLCGQATAALLVCGSQRPHVS